MRLLVGIAAINVLLSCGKLLAGENVGRPLTEAGGGSIPSKAAETNIKRGREVSMCHRNSALAYW